MTHKERRTRRRDIARFVKRGGSDSGAVRGACKEWKVGYSTVLEACRENGVGLTLGPTAGSRTPVRTLLIVARLCNEDTSLHQLAKDLELTVQRVQQVYAECVRCEVPVRTRRKGRPNGSK